MAEHATILMARLKLLAATGKGWRRALRLLVGVTVPATGTNAGGGQPRSSVPTGLISWPGLQITYIPG